MHQVRSPCPPVYTVVARSGAVGGVHHGLNNNVCHYSGIPWEVYPLQNVSCRFYGNSTGALFREGNCSDVEYLDLSGRVSQGS